MDLIWFISGIIIFSKKAVPPNLLGGSIRHTVDQDTSQSIGFLLMLPFVFDIGSAFCLSAVFPPIVSVIILLAAYACAIVAMVVYYTQRKPIPVDDRGMLAGTDIPADKADVAQRIATKAYRPILMVVLMVITGPLGLIFAAWGLILATQAIRLSVEHQVAEAQRKWAQGCVS